MLSKSRIKFIKSLQLKKYRKQEQRFTVEGVKSVFELLESDYVVELLVATPEFLNEHQSLLKRYTGDIEVVKPALLAGLCEFRTNDSALAIARMKPNEAIAVHANEYALVLDDMRDPGNLGTILRIADWYGIDKIITSTETADMYSGKVVQASMGSFTRVRIFYTDLVTYLTNVRVPVWGAFMEGEDVHSFSFGTGGLLVVGNEANGISPEVSKVVSKRITIPRVGKAESLNAAVATAVICDNIRRRA